jgi:hypothetical protein
MKMAVLRVVAPCKLLEAFQHFTGACCLHYQGDPLIALMETASTSETSVKFHRTTRRNKPQDSRLHTRRRENLKSHLINAQVRMREVTEIGP